MWRNTWSTASLAGELRWKAYAHAVAKSVRWRTDLLQVKRSTGRKSDVGVGIALHAMRNCLHRVRGGETILS